MSEIEVKIARAYNLLDAWILLQRLVLSHGRKSELTGKYHVNDIYLRCESCVDDGIDEIVSANMIQPPDPVESHGGVGSVDSSIVKLSNSFNRMEKNGLVSFSVSRTVYGVIGCTVVVTHGEVTITLVSGIQRATVGSAMMMRALTEIIKYVVPDVYSMNAKVNLLITDLFEDQEGAATWAMLKCCQDMVTASEHELVEGIK